MPKLKPKAIKFNLDSDSHVRALRAAGRCVYAWKHPVTGGISFRTYVRQQDWKRNGGKQRKRIVHLVSLSPTASRNEIERACEKVGAPPPWIDRDERKVWRAQWRKRNGHPKREAGLDGKRLVHPEALKGYSVDSIVESEDGLYQLDVDYDDESFDN